MKFLAFCSFAFMFYLSVFSSAILPQERFFYTNKDYGSEALFNPLTLLINGAYDVTQLQLVSDKITELQYKKMNEIVWKNLKNPFYSISQYGWSKFLKTEFFPVSFTPETMQWIPNYQQHLIGGGMLYTAMKEWYDERGFPVPWLFSSVTVMAQHYLNEVIETGLSETAYSVDEISDIYIFDLGGIFLFSIDGVNRFFARKLNLADWSLQAAVALPEGRINAGQYFSMKWKFPFSDDYSLFYRYGMGALYGVSKKINDQDNLSVGVGFRSKHLIDLSNEHRERTISTSWHFGIFYDRNNSLMAQIVLSGVKEYFCLLDLYPGVLHIGNFSPGIWSIFGRDGNITFGFSSKYALNLGYELK